jgi:hypothetical protein
MARRRAASGHIESITKRLGGTTIMATYIGYYRLHPDYWSENGARAREAGHAIPDEVFRAKVSSLRDKLPASIKLIGSYAPIASSPNPERPAVWICECDDPAELTFVNNYYAGYLMFDWAPVTVLGNVASETDAVMRANQARGT